MSEDINTPVTALVPEETKPVAPTPPEVTEEEKEAFFKAFLSDSPYIKSFPLFEGKSSVTFKTLNLDENNAIFQQIRNDQTTGVAKNDDGYFIQVASYRMVASLLKLDDKPFFPELSITGSYEKGSYITARLKEIAKWNVFKLGAVTNSFGKFEDKVRVLTEKALDGNF